jgi:hypothetical protein
MMTKKSWLKGYGINKTSRKIKAGQTRLAFCFWIMKNSFFKPVSGFHVYYGAGDADKHEYDAGVDHELDVKLRSDEKYGEYGCECKHEFSHEFA